MGRQTVAYGTREQLAHGHRQHQDARCLSFDTEALIIGDFVQLVDSETGERFTVSTKEFEAFAGERLARAEMATLQAAVSEIHSVAEEQAIDAAATASDVNLAITVQSNEDPARVARLVASALAGVTEEQARPHASPVDPADVQLRAIDSARADSEGVAAGEGPTDPFVDATIESAEIGSSAPPAAASAEPAPPAATGQEQPQ